MTYRDLQSRAERLSGALRDRGVVRGCRAGIIAFNCIEYVQILFGLLRLGCVCVPLNHRLTAAETARIVQHSGISVLFFGTPCREKVPRNVIDGGMLFEIGDGSPGARNDYEDLIAGYDGCCIAPAKVAPGDTSCIIYTAGTTDAPRGVILTHGNQLWNTRSYTAVYGMTPGDIELAPTQLFHVSTLGRVFTYVYNAVTFVLCSRFDVEACFDLIESEGVTSMTQAPTMYAMMCRSPGRHERDFSGIQRAVTGASPMSPTAKRRLTELFPRAACIDIYGLTEAAPGVTALGPGDFLRRPESVGRPMPGVELSIRDTAGNVLPPRQVGEILCRGPNVMQGYVNDPEATARALAGGWLHTGDMGYVDDDGFLYLSGRRKNIIISGGVNIYPGEVERRLMQHPGVDDAAVFGLADEVWGERVAAAVVRRPGGPTCTESELVRFCRSGLAGFKCPRRIFFVDELPRNAARKVVAEQLKNRFVEKLQA